jgi:3-phosphoshikimate 1-carboxyvinyltransferase
MNITAYPGKPLTGAAFLPGDKSLSHRAALFSAMARGESCLENFLVAGVTRPLLDALSALGVSWDLVGTTLTVRGQGLESWRSPQIPLDCGNSATVLRLLAGALSAAGIRAVLDGTPGLRRRPMGRIVEPLAQMGVPIQTAEGGTAPIELSARPASQSLRPTIYRLPVASAQVKSCLLLAALAAGGPTTLIEPGPSRDHTERMLRSMGVKVGAQASPGDPENPYAQAVTITPPSPLRLAPLRLVLPGDFSSAAFLIVAALITPGSDIRIKNAGLNPTRTGLLDALASMGAQIEINNLAERSGEPVGDLRIQHQPLHGATVDGALVVRMIDEFPAFAIAAACAQGVTTVRQAAELRYKESDRITALGQELGALGVAFQDMPDGFSIQGGEPVQGGTVASHGDHRLAMSLLLAGIAGGKPVTVQDTDIISESFPDFVGVLGELGAELHASG